MFFVLIEQLVVLRRRRLREGLSDDGDGDGAAESLLEM